MREGAGLAAAMSSRTKKAGLALAIGAAAAVAYASPALSANYLYWSQNASPSTSSTVGRANIDGTGANASFAAAGGTVGGIAYNDTHIYWAGPNGVSRANIDGTGVTLIYSGAVAPGLAIDSQYFYAYSPAVSGGHIIRGNLDGSGVNSTFISAADAFYLTIDSKYIYWTDSINSQVGRANLDGTGVNASFISVPTGAAGLAVNGTSIFWSVGPPTNAIGRANLDGTGANPTFISGLLTPLALAADNNYVYWSQGSGPKTIARANVDGSGVNASFLSTSVTSNIYGIAVSPAGSAPPKYALSVTKAGTGAGTVTSSPAGVECGATCSAEYDSGTSVTLTAAPASGSNFTGWAGACAGAAATCTVTMSQAQSVTATFDTIPVPSNAFTVRTPLLVGTAIRTLVRVPGPGVIRQTGTFRSGGKVRPACTTATRTASAAGIYRLRCRTYDVVRAARRKGPVRVLVTTTYRPTGGTARVVLRTVVLRSLKPRYTG